MNLTAPRISSRTTTTRGRRTGGIALTAGVAASLVLGAALTAGSASGSERPKGLDPTTCTPEEYAALAEAGDNFALRCELPGQTLAGLKDLDSEPEPGVVKSDNIVLKNNVPKSGAFAEEGAYGTDLAFQGRYAYGGNYNGFTVYDLKRKSKPVKVAQVVCPGGQNDISVLGDLLVLSVDSSRNDDSCSSVSQSASEKSSWEGLRVFDISKPHKPRYVAAVETKCGSHTNTLAPSHSGRAVFVYVSSYGPSSDYPDCQPPHDLISVVKVPVKNPHRAKVVAEPVLFPDGGNPGGGAASDTDGCHDITAYPARDIAAGACMGDGILLDISNRAKPVVTERVTDDNFAFWHSATFNNAGTKVVFTDELGGGAAPTCNPALGPTRGANGIYDIVRGKLQFRSYYKMPRTQSLTENCVAHNGSLIPVPGKDLMVQAWYQGGVSVFDFTDSANPVEIAYYDRPALSETEMQLGGSWSSYWYNGRVYSNDITRGLDTFVINDKRVKPAKKVRMGTFNAQSQPSYNG